MALIVLLLLTATGLLLVGGQYPYKLAIDFHQYSNPSHTISNGQCCSSVDCTSDCATFLQLCIRTGGTSHTNLNCPAGIEYLGSIGGDNVTFTVSVGNEDNPFARILDILPVSGYQLAMEFFVPLNGLPIDRIFVEIPASTLGQSSLPQTYSGKFLTATVSLSYSLGCASSYTLCTVNTVLDCISEDECINGFESVTLLTPQTTLAMLSGQSHDASTVIVPASAMPSPTMDAIAAGGPVVAIVGGVLATLLLVSVIAILVLMGIAVSLYRRKKQSSPTNDEISNTYMLYSELYRENSVHPYHPNTAIMQQSPNEHIVYEEIGDHKQSNAYETVDPSHDREGTPFDVANPMYNTATLSGSREPEYQEAHGDPSCNRNNTLTVVANPMYQTTTLPESREPEYQETQKEVQNILYEGQTNDFVDSVNDPMYTDVKN